MLVDNTERRKLVAIVEVDNEKSFAESDGPVSYLEKEFGWLEQSGIKLEKCFIADDDDESTWQRYLNYLVDWAFTHQGEEFIGSAPVCFDEWVANEEVSS